MIEIRDLTKNFGSTLAVDNVSFQVEPGEVLGFLGPNGAGKTTTMRILTGFLHADAGTATVAGYDVAEQGLEVRRRIGYLPESSPIYQDMGVVEYLRYIAAMRGIGATERTTRIKRMVDACGLGSVLKKDVGELSKGNRLEFRDFGVFEVKARRARRAQNPRTLEKVDVPPKRVVKFKVGRVMRDCVMPLPGEPAPKAESPQAPGSTPEVAQG